MENTCKYSDEWQPYINDYDKFEYDIKLKDGAIIENCYPNGGLFNSISDLHDEQAFQESEISEIRFSHNPRFGINSNVSEKRQFDYLDLLSQKNEYIKYEKLPEIPMFSMGKKFLCKGKHQYTLQDSGKWSCECGRIL